MPFTVQAQAQARIVSGIIIKKMEDGSVSVCPGENGNFPIFSKFINFYCAECSLNHCFNIQLFFLKNNEVISCLNLGVFGNCGATPCRLGGDLIGPYPASNIHDFTFVKGAGA